MATELDTGTQGAPAAQVDAVLFDLCGVVIDWQPAAALEGLYPERLVEDFTSFGDRCGFLYFDDLLDGGETIAGILPRYTEEYGPELAKVLQTYYQRIEHGLVRLMPGMPELIADLHEHGIGTWGLTNFARETWPRAQKRFPELDTLLSGIAVSGIERMKKPERRFYELACTRFGLDPTRTLFVDDNALNVDAARELGMQGLTFIDADHTRAHLASLGVVL